ncbi:hypothetical protein JCM12298_25640 [Desulfothermus naphthae]
MRRFNVKFTEKNLTGNAGLVLLGLFADKLKLPKMLEQHITIKRGASAQYKVSDIIMILMMAVLAGAKHMSHVFILRSDLALRSLFKWERFPDDTTISRVFKLFNLRHCNELSDVETKVRKKVWGKKMVWPHHFRFGLYCAWSVWETGRCREGLQPQEARTKRISSVTLLYC